MRPRARSIHITIRFFLPGFAARMLGAMAIFVPTIALAQNPGAALSIKRSSRSGQAIFVTAPGGGAIPLQPPAGRAQIEPIDFLVQHGAIFGITDPANELTPLPARTDRLARRHTTYLQVHRGVPVFSGAIKIHQDAAGQVYAANGRYYPVSMKVDVVPTIDIQQAQQAALAAINHGAPRVIQFELTIVDPGWYGDPRRGARLAYHLILYDPLAAICEAFFVDAHSGAILDQWSMIHTARNRFIYDGEGTFDLPGELARGEGDPAATLADVNRAYDYYGDVYDYFARAFGRDSIDGFGLNMVATVNSIAPGCPNAYWDPISLQMVFCAGAVTDDIVGHELTHGVTQFTADLIYQNQSGQLNESFSDVFGELVDQFNGNAAFVMPPGAPLWPTHATGPGLDTPNILRGTTTCSLPLSYLNGVRWLVGEDAVAFGGAIRDMWNPNCDTISPDYANSPFQVCYASDYGGVHIGSGVPNHAFSIVTDGKTFNGYTVTGIGPIKSGAVWYRALTTYLTVTSDFEDAYHALNQAAADLIGTFPNDPRTGLPSASAFTANDADQVDLALRAVEMNTTGACGQTVDVLSDRPPPICPLRSVIFRDDFENGINGWTTSNSGAPSLPFDWNQSSSLPYGRIGTAWFSPDIGPISCISGALGSLNSLTSPAIVLPAAPLSPTLAFTHLISTEPQFDGGTVRLSVNGGSFNVIPRSAFKFNAYNGRLRSTSELNSAANGVQNQQAFSGENAHWGTSVIDLGGLAPGGSSIRIRFEIGHDSCSGDLGWYIDDFEIFTCPDCNNNGIVDDDEYSFQATSSLQAPIGTTSQVFTISTPPHARGDVTLRFTAIGDFDYDWENSDNDCHPNNCPVDTCAPNACTIEDEFLNVYLGNGPPVNDGYDLFLGRLFLQYEGRDCNYFLNPDLGEFVVSDSNINLVLDYVTANPKVTVAGGGPDVSNILCGTYNFIAMDVQYSGRTSDCNNNGRLDRLDIEQRFSLDVCENGIPDECECDCNTNGMPDACELANHTATDCNLDGILDECQGGPAAGVDCNGNLTPDSCDIAEGVSADCNHDGIPDECFPALTVNAGPDVAVELSLGQQTVQIGGALNILGGVFPFQFAFTWEIVSPSPASGSFNDKHHRTPMFRPNAPGAYVLRCTARDLNSDGCTNFDEITVTIASLKADAGPDRVGCVNQPTVPFGGEPVATGGIPPYSYTWSVLSGGADFPGGSKSSDHPTYTPTTTANHVIQVSVQDSSNPPVVATDTLTLRVGDDLTIDIAENFIEVHPILTIGEDFDVGSGFSVNGGIPPYIYDWSVLSGPGGDFEGGNTPDAVFSSFAPGAYVIRLNVMDQGGCSTETQFTLSVVTDPPSSKVPVTVTPEGNVAVCGVGLCGPTGAVSFGGTLLGLLALRPYRRRLRR